MDLDLVRAGSAFGEVSAMLAANHPDPNAAVAEAGALLAGWLGGQIVAGMLVEADGPGG